MSPSTSTSAGHDTALDLELVQRADRVRALDRRVGRTLKVIARWTLILGLPALLLGAVLFPPVHHSQCRSKQSEAKGNLKALYVAEETYRAELDRYVTDPDALGFTPKGHRIRYDYLVRSDGASFEAFAVGVDDAVAGDVWRIDEHNDLEHLVNACQ